MLKGLILTWATILVVIYSVAGSKPFLEISGCVLPHTLMLGFTKTWILFDFWLTVKCFSSTEYDLVKAAFEERSQQRDELQNEQIIGQTD